MTATHGRTIGATAGIAVCDAVALLADINIGAIATAISMLSVAGAGGVYVGITKYAEARAKKEILEAEAKAKKAVLEAEAKAKAHRLWLEANKDDLTAELHAAKAKLDESLGEIQANTAEIAELKETLRKRDDYLAVVQAKKDVLSDRLEVMSVRFLEREGVILERTTTKLKLPSSGDDLPAIPGLEHDGG